METRRKSLCGCSGGGSTPAGGGPARAVLPRTVATGQEDGGCGEGARASVVQSQPQDASLVPHPNMEICRDFPAGRCQLGDKCHRVHDPCIVQLGRKAGGERGVEVSMRALCLQAGSGEDKRPELGVGGSPGSSSLIM